MKQTKICAWPVLRRNVENLRKKGKKIVFTNGCFDLLHVGHLKVFENCKKYGDVLVVGLNSDRSVRRLKGPKRPLIPFTERACLLAGFSVIDFVTVFHEDTPEKLIRFLRPDVLVKGGDWKVGEIVGRDVVKKVVRIPLVQGHSTTELIQRIVRRYGK